MCFSATGSFAIAGVLAGMGAVSVVRNTSGPARPFAAIPLIFAAQQATEGVVWLTVGDSQSELLNRLAVNVFLGIALVVWPVWAPWSLRLVEQDPVRRRVLTMLTRLGGAVSMVAAVLLARWQPQSVIAGHSIRYDYAGASDPMLSFVLLAAYVVPTVAPFFVSSARVVRIIGASLAASLVFTYLMQRDTLTSVWCFFAAVLSVQILLAASSKRVGVPALR
jgi:hypothetical protein